MLGLFPVSNTLILNVDYQKAMEPFCTSQGKAIEENSSLLSLDLLYSILQLAGYTQRHKKKKKKKSRIPFLVQQ